MTGDDAPTPEPGSGTTVPVDPRPLRGLIAAISLDGVIGLHGTIPWTYRGDLRRFKELTRGTTVVMGRLTWESMGSRPLPDRHNVVVTSRAIEGVTCVASIEAALALAGDDDVWFIGGARVYADAMKHGNLIDLTLVPEVVEHPDAVRFPTISMREWVRGETVAHPYNAELTIVRYSRRCR